MSISVECGHCFTPFHVAERFAGKTLRCKSCGEAMRVPLDSRSDMPADESVGVYDFGASGRARRVKSSSARKQSSQPIGMSGWLPLLIIAGLFVLLFPIALMVLPFGKIYILMALLTGLVIYFWGQISLLIVAFKDGAGPGLFCFFLTPIYVIYMLCTDWRKIARPTLRLVAAVVLFHAALAVQFINWPPAAPKVARQPRQQPKIQLREQLPNVVRNAPPVSRDNVTPKRPNPGQPQPNRRSPVGPPRVSTKKPRINAPTDSKPHSKVVRSNAPLDANQPPPPGTGPLDPDAELTPGMRVVAQRNGSSWEVAEIVEVEPTGKVQVHYLRLPAAFDRAVSREQIRLQLSADQVDAELVRELVYEIRRYLGEGTPDEAAIESEFLHMEGYLPGSLKIDQDSQRITLKVIHNSRAEKFARLPLGKAKLLVREIEDPTGN